MIDLKDNVKILREGGLIVVIKDKNGRPVDFRILGGKPKNV